MRESNRKSPLLRNASGGEGGGGDRGPPWSLMAAHDT